MEKNVECKIRATMKLIFPERDSEIGAFYLVAKTHPGVIIENTGIPLMILIRQDVAFDPRRDSNIRLITDVLETESDHFLMIKYKKNLDPTPQRLRNIFKISIDDRKPNVLAVHPKLSDAEIFKRRLLDDLRVTLSW